MADLFLNGPLFVAARNEAVPRDTVQHFFYTDGCAAQTDAKIGIELGGKIKFKFAFKPLAGVAHQESLTGAGG